MKKASLLFISIFSTGTISSFAQQGYVNGTQPLQLLALAQIVVNKLSPILVTIALLSFFWLVIKFIRNSDNPSEQAKTKSGILYAILALFVLVSIWGIVGNLQILLGVVGNGNQPNVDTLPPGWKQ
jgi:hypothetical protein